jgi:predicted PolB exonuclease-like 3'-5' exonuclease
MIYKTLDIETVPDHRVWEPKLKWVLGEYGSSRAEEPFPPPQAHRVVAISTVDLHGGIGNPLRYHYASCRSICHWDQSSPQKADEVERQLLIEFHQIMKAAADQGDFILITWNGRGFDLPVLSMRSMKYGIPCPWYYQDSVVRYRYKEEGHTDLMDYLSDYGSAPKMKLGDVARLIGLPGKTDLTGAGVHDLYAKGDVEGNMRQVGAYCLSDTLQTTIIYLRTMLHIGRLEPENYDLALESIRSSEACAQAKLEVDWAKLKLDPATTFASW